MLRELVTVLFILISIALIVVVLMQEGKSAGLSGAFGGSGAGDTYWGKNKGRSIEGTLLKITRVLGAAFIVVAAVLSLY